MERSAGISLTSPGCRGYPLMAEPASLIAMGGALAALLIRKGRFRPRRTKEQI
ncbi:MAG: PEP-CTERM sorting domain-containing protein [Armatimonadetes bacterium]|nr:MAG: PEP-CTERM sorting domain-containing protein [Armatimonadota bacterium]